MKLLKIEKKWMILGISIIAILGVAFFYYKNVNTIFTQSEYIKEVIIQNQNFNDTLDVFLNQAITYKGTKEQTEKIEETALKLTNFVNTLEKKLGPKVPEGSKKHYEQMIKTYYMYLEGIDMYKSGIFKIDETEHETMVYKAQNKIVEARIAMNNIK